MSKRLITLMAALLVLGFAYAGCGGDDEKSSASDTVTDVETVTDDEVVTDTETVTEQTDTTPTTPTETETSESGGAVAPERAQAVASCKSAVTSYEQLPQDTKSKLERLCEKAGSGDESDVRAASRAVCEQIVQDLYPSGVPGKSKALEACESAAQ